MLIKAERKRIRILRKRLLELNQEYFLDYGTNRGYFTEKGNYYYLFIDDIGYFAGYGMLRTFNRFNIPTLGMAIWKGHRKKGKGTQLLYELINKAKKLGFRKIRLHTLKTLNISIHMYEKAGFKIINDDDKKISMELILIGEKK